MRISKFAILLFALVVAACSKSIQGTYAASRPELGTLRFEPNGQVTYRDSKEKATYTAAYDINDEVISIEDSHFPHKLHMLDRERLEVTGGDAGTVIYSKK